jgi:hypothetical protein
MFCLLWSTILDVEEGGIKIKKIFFHGNGNFFYGGGRKKGKQKIIFIPNHHFWMSEGSLNKV